MPTIFRFRNFRILILTDDHGPAHVHAFGPGCVVVFNLNCYGGPVTLRENHGVSAAQQAALANFLNPQVELLCKAWEEIHGDPTRV